MGRYEIVRRIGRGGMAEVFVAKRRDAGGVSTPIVIKRLLPHLSANADMRRRFLDEARLLTRLDHPNIVRILDVTDDDDEPGMVMEYVEGLSLNVIGRKQRTPIELAHVLRIGCYLCEALSYAHACTDRRGRPLGVVHRDITPGNVVVGANGAVKLIDFGIARNRDRLFQTVDGRAVGTMGYTAPEQVTPGETVDSRADLFGLGVLLYVLLSRRLPFGARQFDQVPEAVRAGPQPLTELRPDLPPGLWETLGRAMAPAADDRHATALELQLELEEIAARERLFSNTTRIAAWVSALTTPPASAPAPGFDEGRVRTEADGDALSDFGEVTLETVEQPRAGRTTLTQAG
jgi:serine/threonine-protein kinase